MYYVIGADGNQYGPIDEAQLRAWIREGRVGAPTLSFRTGEAQWVPMSGRADFEAEFAALTAPAPAPPRSPVAVTPDSPKEWLVALLLSIFFGYFAVDRFYLGHVGLGIAKLLTCGGLGVWWLIDIILIATGSLRDSNGRLLVRYGTV